MLNRIHSNLGRLKNNIRSAMENVSYDFDKLEKEIGNSQASRILSDLENNKSEYEEIYEEYREIIRELDRMEDRIRDLEYDFDSTKQKIPDSI